MQQQDPIVPLCQGTQNAHRRQCRLCDQWSPLSASQQAARSLELNGEVEKKQEKRHFKEDLVTGAAIIECLNVNKADAIL